jgi:hypothetical protein
MLAVPHPADLLAAWEQSEGQRPVDRALALLALADESAALAGLTVAERDERLVALRTRLWGERLDAFAECPACGERLELAIDTGALGRAPEASSWSVAAGGVEVRFRLPDSTDLAAAAACRDPDQRRRVLAGRCVEDGPDGELPEGVIAAMAARMAEVAGPADAAVAIACPACEHQWEEALDVPAFVWHELSVAARRLLGDVDTLARTYGWSEEAVLALPPHRRHRYVELAG